MATLIKFIVVQSRIGVSARQGSPPDSMISSYHGHTSGSALDLTPSAYQSMSTSLIENIKKSSSAADVLMSQSLDLNNLRNNHNYSPLMQHNPLAAASKMMPVPESLMSPDCGPISAAHMLPTSARIAQNSTPNRAVTAGTAALKKGEYFDSWIAAIDLNELKTKALQCLHFTLSQIPLKPCPLS